MIKVVCGVLMKDDRFLITQKGDQKNYGLNFLCIAAVLSKCVIR